jgi:hypothetical protein
LREAVRSKTNAGGEKHRKGPRRRAFAQILGKYYFFDLLENLRRILLDYAQKRSCTANAAFKAAC